ncbi:MAG TPA: hypothetical protein PKI60_06945 [Oscillospiraceae bacterium]|nr:hypothetical protein [Oscillospiraceae bacterium]
MPELALNYDYKFSINTTPSAQTETFSQISDGFDNVSMALNEVLYQGSFLGDSGYGSTEVTGGQLTLTISGVRKIGDAAQDYIFGNAVKNSFGSARKTTFKIEDPKGNIITGSCTLAKVTESGGAANQPNAISVEIHFNGKPTYTAAT